jgi:hypothetical protein
MAFVIDYGKASNRHDVQDGEYEVTVIGAAWNKTAGGTEYIQVKLQVRQDVQQPEQNETIDYPLWKSRPENRKQSDIDGVPAWKIHQLSKAADLGDGETVNTLDDWFRLIQGKPVRVTTRQDDQGRAKVVRVDESQVPQVAKGFVPVDEPLPWEQ